MTIKEANKLLSDYTSNVSKVNYISASQERQKKLEKNQMVVLQNEGNDDAFKKIKKEITEFKNEQSKFYLELTYQIYMVERVIGRLDSPYREILNQKYIYQIKNIDLAKMFDCSVSRIFQLLREAIKRFANEYDKTLIAL